MVNIFFHINTIIILNDIMYIIILQYEHFYFIFITSYLQLQISAEILILFFKVHVKIYLNF